MGALLIILALAQPANCDGWFKQMFFIECATYVGGHEKNERPGSRTSDRLGTVSGGVTAVDGAGGVVGGGKGPRLGGGGGKTHTNRGVGTGTRGNPGGGKRP